MCSLHFRIGDSRNYLNRRIPERCFSFKFALSILLPRKGTKHSRERVNSPLRLLKQSLGALRDTTEHEMFPHWRGRMFSQCSWSCVQEFEQCHKVAILGKPLLVYLETLRQVAKIDHAQGQIQCLHAVSLPEPFSLFLLFRLTTRDAAPERYQITPVSLQTLQPSYALSKMKTKTMPSEIGFPTLTQPKTQ